MPGARAMVVTIVAPKLPAPTTPVRMGWPAASRARSAFRMGRFMRRPRPCVLVSWAGTQVWTRESPSARGWPVVLEAGQAHNRFLRFSGELRHRYLSRPGVGIQRDDLSICFLPVLQEEEPPAIDLRSL